MRRLLLGLSILLLPIPALATAQSKLPFEGRWSLRTVADCKKPFAEVGENKPHKFSRTELEFYESSCRVRSIKRDGDTFTLTTLCQGEGETWRETVHLRALGDNRLERIQGTGRDRTRVLYTRCD
ncbi:MAG: hypothetical protein M3145_10235 [Pseudomonadota bacterium]|nr:hypothetical protein [Pseudomonadota bacterium]